MSGGQPPLPFRESFLAGAVTNGAFLSPTRTPSIRPHDGDGGRDHADDCGRGECGHCGPGAPYFLREREEHFPGLYLCFARREIRRLLAMGKSAKNRKTW